jgi:hypothetical protein
MAVIIATFPATRRGAAMGISALGGAIVLAVLQNRLAAQLSYLGAMRAAIAVPVVALLAGALLCLGLQAPRQPAQQPEPRPATQPGQAADVGAGAVRHPSRPQRSGTGRRPPTPARCDLDHIEKPPATGNRFRYETVPYR